MVTFTISQIIAIGTGLLGCLVGLAGWLRGHDQDGSADAEWRGQISTKLDNIMENVAGQREMISSLDNRLRECERELATLEASAKQAHKRIDGIQGKGV